MDQEINNNQNHIEDANNIIETVVMTNEEERIKIDNKNYDWTTEETLYLVRGVNLFQNNRHVYELTLKDFGKDIFLLKNRYNYLRKTNKLALSTINQFLKINIVK